MAGITGQAQSEEVKFLCLNPACSKESSHKKMSTKTCPHCGKDWRWLLELDK